MPWGEIIKGQKVNVGVMERFIIMIDGSMGLCESQNVKLHNLMMDIACHLYLTET